MAWSFQFVGQAGNVATALAAATITTSNPDEVNQLAGVRSYLATKLASVPTTTGVFVTGQGASTATGVFISTNAQVITLS